jgi:hypothetical protein
MLPRKKQFGFGFTLRLSYAGTHICGREVEIEDISLSEKGDIGVVDDPRRLRIIKNVRYAIKFSPRRMHGSTLTREGRMIPN